MAAILFNDVEPFEQIINIPLTEGPLWNLVKIDTMLSEKKTVKEYTILYMYVAQGQWWITPEDKILTRLLLLKGFTSLLIRCKFQPLVFNTFWERIS